MDNINENFKVRISKEDDSKRVWEIRNHPIVRENSNSSEIIDFEKHNYWFQTKYFSSLDNYCYVLENESKIVIGYCRFDFDSEQGSYTISIALDPESHGKGLGHYLLSESLSQLNADKDILAEIKKQNIASIKLFQKNNFKIYKEDYINYYLKFIYGL